MLIYKCASGALCDILHLYTLWTYFGHGLYLLFELSLLVSLSCVLNIHITYSPKLLHLYYHYTNRHGMKNYCDALKEVDRSSSTVSSLFLSADRNMLITDKQKILEGRAEHYSILNYSSAISNVAIGHLPKYQSKKHWMTHKPY